MPVVVKIVWVQVPSSADVRVAQLDRAFGYGPKGREFESSRPRIKSTSRNRSAFLVCHYKMPVLLRIAGQAFSFMLNIN